MGECICSLSWRVHYNFVCDGRYCKRGGHATSHHPHQPWIIFPSKPESGRCHSVSTLCFFYPPYLPEFNLYVGVYSMFTITLNVLLQDTVVLETGASKECVFLTTCDDHKINFAEEDWYKLYSEWTKV